MNPPTAAPHSGIQKSSCFISCIGERTINGDFLSFFFPIPLPKREVVSLDGVDHCGYDRYIVQGHDRRNNHHRDVFDGAGVKLWNSGYQLKDLKVS